MRSSILKRFNQAIYSSYYFLHSIQVYFITEKFFRLSAKKIKDAYQSHPLEHSNNFLFISWGFIGDALLSTSILRNFRVVFPDYKIIIVGSKSVKGLLEPFCDEYIVFSTKKWKASASYRGHLFQNLLREYKIIVGDIHLFNSGIFYMKNFFEMLPSKFKFYYSGYLNRKSYAPFRLLPQNTIIINPPFKDTDAQHHIINDYIHYFNKIIQKVKPGWQSGFPHIHFRPLIDLEIYKKDTDISYFNLKDKDYIACQIISNNPKRDYPLKKWTEIFNSFPKIKFVILGAMKDLKKTSNIHSRNVINLCGKTNIEQAILLIDHSRLFIGLDSGLSHISTVLGKNTICIIDNSKYGYFFPYPDFLNYHNQTVIYNKNYMNCKRCFMICEKENIFKSYLLGSKCLRTIPAIDVILEIKKLL
ncbi:MAG: hypothetical protein GWP10_15215 [Nitrospiraceae bacterium]|nr:hypothetical protein [Nitrospiraceae bacterium]